MTQQPIGLLVDIVRCGGCRQCIEACQEEHGVEADAEEAVRLSATACTAISAHDDYSVRNLCRHCLAPSCASVCPVAALTKSPLGPVTYDAAKCIGCRYCMVACPFSVPRYEWRETNPGVMKCDLCIGRLERGEIPACAAACRQEATTFGPRDELIAEAHARIAEDPDEYYDHVYGEYEIGGTSVLFLAPFPLEELGYAPILGTDPLPQLTELVPKRIPAIATIGGAALMALWWITRRRNELDLARAAAAAAAHERDLAQAGRESDHATD